MTAPRILPFLILLAGCATRPAPEPAGEVRRGSPQTLQISSGAWTLVADHHSVPDAHAVVVLFHQGGGSARGEYAFLVPDLLAAGHDVVTPDLPGGGDRFGPPNRTLARRPEPEGWSYCDALPDIRAVLDHARGVAGQRPVVAWGSSYSAALVILAAAADPDGIAAVLSFSPASGEPMEGCRPEEVAHDMDVPLLVVRPENEVAIPWVAEQLDLFAAAGHDTLIARPGAHGSSALNPERAGDVAATRARVFRFLAAHVGPPAR